MIMKQKPIIIWWGVNTSYSFLEEGLRAEEPVPILKKFLTECATTDVKKKGYINPSGQVGSASDLAHCPAIIDELKNVYGIKSYYDYTLNIDSQNAISTEDYGQDFFNKHITVRSERLLSFKQGWLFFAPYEKNLLMSQQHPFLEDNDVTNNTIIIPGQFDCARYFRDLEFAFIFKKKTTSVQFLKDEITCYIRFHTKRPIILKQFFWDKRINDYYHPLMASKHHKYSHGPVSKILPFYYKLFDKFQFKKKLIKIIENNLVKE